MTKEQLEQKTLEVLDDKFSKMRADVMKVVFHMDADLIEAWDDDYFLPKAFTDALYDMNSEHVTSRSYSLSYARKYQNALRSFKKEIQESRLSWRTHQ